MAKNKDYFGLGRVISLILAIIPLTSWIFGIVTRLGEGKLAAAVIRVFLGWGLIWILDLIFMITKKSILRLINI